MGLIDAYLTNKPRDFLATLGIYSMQPSALNTIEWIIVSLWDNVIQKIIANSEYEIFIRHTTEAVGK